MRGIGYLLGFPSLVVLFFTVIGFVIRRKWRLAMARKAEIKRLLVLAAEEAARAELEVSSGYGYRHGYVADPASAVAPISTSYQCAVCYSPTTTRCARCKAVRYWYSCCCCFLFANFNFLEILLNNLLIWFYNCHNCLIWRYCIL